MGADIKCHNDFNLLLLSRVPNRCSETTVGLMSRLFLLSDDWVSRQTSRTDKNPEISGP